jgi:hypothetical protein
MNSGHIISYGFSLSEIRSARTSASVPSTKSRLYKLARGSLRLGIPVVVELKSELLVSYIRKASPSPATLPNRSR